MGWSSGEGLFYDICFEAGRHIKSDKDFEKFIREIVVLFEQYDADTLFDYLDNSRTGKILKKIGKERGYFN